MESTSNTTVNRPECSSTALKYAIPIVGATFLWLPELFILNSTRADIASFFFTNAAYPWFLLFGTVAVGCLLFSRVADIKGTTWLLVLSAFVYAFGIALHYLALLAPSLASFFWIGAALAGMGFGVLMMKWGSFFIDIPLRAIKIIMLCVAALTALASLVPAALPLSPSVLLAASLLPLASAWLLQQSERFVPTFGREMSRLPRKSVRIKSTFIIGIASVSIGFGIMKTLSLTGSFSFPLGGDVLLSLITVSLLAFILLNRKESGYSVSWKIIVTIMILGFLLLMMRGQESIGQAYAVSSIGYDLFEYVLWIASVDAAKYSKQPPLRFVAYTFVFTIGGQFFGSIVAGTLLEIVDLSQAAFLLGALSIVAMVAAIIWFFPADVVRSIFTDQAGELKQQNGSDAMPSKTHLLDNAAKQEDLKRQLRLSYNLTERETEVAALLSNGRSAKFIQQELVISESTAWTHIRHIYRKMEVATRQEYLTKIEELGQSEYAE
ncbi:helix-turn-helix transcriptional regulator [Eggerthella sp. YY7918]|uniref:helix-turn-helix domain-containing protein n=1 Tax=Eggerthella sp. (strain YY7918) TaxID=502558 RepID=UPI00021710E8|nr:helix-turn-helix transcriptional regulator [Eggerthella sp. YY7918]BAK43533.1 response regulator [Eggerthella sp. YY7918]